MIRSVAQRMMIVAAIEQDVNMVIRSSIKPKLTMNTKQVPFPPRLYTSIDQNDIQSHKCSSPYVLKQVTTLNKAIPIY